MEEKRRMRGGEGMKKLESRLGGCGEEKGEN